MKCKLWAIHTAENKKRQIVRNWFLDCKKNPKKQHLSCIQTDVTNFHFQRISFVLLIVEQGLGNISSTIP